MFLEDALPVRRLAGSLPASFSAGLAAGPVPRLVALRFVWVAATSFPEDLHLLSMPMLGAPKKTPQPKKLGRQEKNPGNDLLSHTVTRAVPLAREGLTSEFGMGSGVAPPL